MTDIIGATVPSIPRQTFGFETTGAAGVQGAWLALLVVSLFGAEAYRQRLIHRRGAAQRERQLQLEHGEIAKLLS